SGERFELGPGDAVVFRGDQRHSYHNLDSRRPAVAISVVCFATGA
ncbi:MAG TPA: cupin domain-containing protein, partial [Myxococcota bacterium]|nr:cupin domain-containing protein [Myxococcota bacterium]